MLLFNRLLFCIYFDLELSRNEFLISLLLVLRVSVSFHSFLNGTLFRLFACLKFVLCQVFINLCFCLICNNPNIYLFHEYRKPGNQISKLLQVFGIFVRLWIYWMRKRVKHFFRLLHSRKSFSPGKKPGTALLFSYWSGNLPNLTDPSFLSSLFLTYSLKGQFLLGLPSVTGCRVSQHLKRHLDQ